MAAPALEEHQQLKETLGKFDLSAAQPYQGDRIGQAFLRLPDRSQQDAWNEARLALQNTAAEECRQASKADHLRQFAGNPNSKTKTGPCYCCRFTLRSTLTTNANRSRYGFRAKTDRPPASVEHLCNAPNA